MYINIYRKQSSKVTMFMSFNNETKFFFTLFICFVSFLVKNIYFCNEDNCLLNHKIIHYEKNQYSYRCHVHHGTFRLRCE